MAEKTDIIYEFQAKNMFDCFLIPAIFLPLYYDSDMNLIFKILIYITPVWLLKTFSYNKMTIFKDHIFYTQYNKPFTKTYIIPFSDIEKVNVSRWEMSKASPLLVVTSKQLHKKFKVQIYSGIDEQLCEYFMDRKIKVETNNGTLRNHMWHYALGHRKKKDIN